MRALIVLIVGAVAAFGQTAGAPKPAAQSSAAPDRALLDQYCVSCHNQKAKIAELTLDKMDLGHVSDGAEKWEKVVLKLRAGLMPPAGSRRPDRAVIDGFVSKLETELDRAGAANPNPGVTALHRINRTEYGFAVRDLLGLEIDSTTLLPADDSSEGFDNVADALNISPALLERYVSAATKISRVAVGDMAIAGTTTTFRN